MARVRSWDDKSAVGVEFREARDLYLALFPAESREAIRKAKRLVISPDGPLWDLPFAALIIPGEKDSDDRFLGLEKPLTYAQSLTLFALSTRERPAARKGKQEVLVVGNPVYDPAERQRIAALGPDTRIAANPLDRQRPLPSDTRRPLPSDARRPLPSDARRGAGRKDLPDAQGERRLATRDGKVREPLPGAEIEAEEVAGGYKSNHATGILRTEKWLRERCPTADVIHLATHGFLSPYLAANSGVMLAVPEKEPAAGETDDDGVLQSWEIYRMKLRAEVVVLSACETGQGAKVRGEGLVGLTRALQVPHPNT